MHHFFKAVIENNLEAEGFMAYKVSGIHPYQRTNTFYDKVGNEFIELDPVEIVIDSQYPNEKIIRFKDEIIIVYTLKEWNASPFPDLPNQVSWIRLTGNGLKVHTSGYVYNPVGYEVYGYRSSDRVLQMLPYPWRDWPNNWNSLQKNYPC